MPFSYLPLPNLSQLPTAIEERRALLTGATGRILHEMGHFLDNAINGIPTDYVFFAWRAGYEAAYINQKYRTEAERDVRTRVKMYAAGFVAEHLIFGEAELGRASDDLERIAELRGIGPGKFDVQKLSNAVLSDRGLIFSADAKPLLETLYQMAAGAIASGRFRTGGVDVLPFHALNASGLKITFRRRMDAMVRTRLGYARQAALRGFEDLRVGLGK